MIRLSKELSIVEKNEEARRMPDVYLYFDKDTGELKSYAGRKSLKQEIDEDPWPDSFIGKLSPTQAFNVSQRANESEEEEDD